MKTVLLRATSLLVSLGALVMITPMPLVQGADFLVDTASPLLQEGGFGDERAFNIAGVSDANSVVDNIKALFYPGSDSGGAFWDILRTILVGVLIVLFVWTGAQLMSYANDPDEVKRNLLSLLYIIVGSVLIFAMLRLLSQALNLGTVSGLTGDGSIVENAEQNVFLVVLTAMKGIAFFMAIVFLVYYGYRMITAFDSTEKQSAAKKGMINVIVALIFIKIIDYLYFIAQQDDLKSRAITLVVEVSKFLGYFMGIAVVILVIYAGFRMITSNGNEEAAQKAGNAIRTIFVAFVVLMLFLLIIYQILNDVL